MSSRWMTCVKLHQTLELELWLAPRRVPSSREHLSSRSSDVERRPKAPTECLKGKITRSSGLASCGRSANRNGIERVYKRRKLVVFVSVTYQLFAKCNWPGYLYRLRVRACGVNLPKPSVHQSDKTKPKIYSSHVCLLPLAVCLPSNTGF